jgi:transglutaminase-like putative cysteine protease
VKYEQQIPRNALVWIIITQFLLLLPHLPQVPIWVVGVYLLAAGWRTMVYLGRWSFPGKWTKAVLSISCVAGIMYYFRTLLSLEAWVALLLTAFALKLIEAAQRKDSYLLVFVAYFICVTVFLFSQDLLTTFYMILVVWVITTALVAIHQPGEDVFTRATMRRSGVMLAQSFPLMLVLFFIFPRIGPLWSMPLKSTAAKSGMSDFMSPGDVSNLSLSDEVAFRVQFDGPVPPRQELYWRGLVMSRLQEDAWRSLRWLEVPARERKAWRPDASGRAVNYSVIMEPTQQNWLYALRYPTSRDGGVMETNDFRLVSPTELQDQRRYRVRSLLDVPLETELSQWRREIEIDLPLFGNPRTRELAAQMFLQAGEEPEQFVDAVLTMFRSQQFFYTLRPPLLGDEPMDEFLFDSRRGFCEHYAASFAFMVRSVGIPARVVAGYQGGEINPLNGTVVVHQFDAHAWNEVWFEGRGWVRVDPTAAIAPDRIEFGLEQALFEEGSFLADSPLSPLRYRNIAWVNRIRLQLDAVNYSWQLFVLNYDSDRQYQVLNEWLGEVTPQRVAALLFAFWGLVLIPVAIGLLRRGGRSRLEPATRLYYDFCRKLERHGLGRARGEAPGDYAMRVALERPELAAEVRSISGLYDRLSYREEASAEALQLLRRQVRGFRPRSRETEPPA